MLSLSSIVDMIRSLADMGGTQFIATTFRPEIVKVTDKIYGVTLQNRMSHINVTSKEQALEFIERDETHNANRKALDDTEYGFLFIFCLVTSRPLYYSMVFTTFNCLLSAERSKMLLQKGYRLA